MSKQNENLSEDTVDLSWCDILLGIQSLKSRITEMFNTLEALLMLCKLHLRMSTEVQFKKTR